MTSSSSVFYPTEWHVADNITGTEVRQTSDDTYQLRTVEGIYTLNKEGFELYRSATGTEFQDWIDAHPDCAKLRNDSAPD